MAEKVKKVYLTPPTNPHFDVSGIAESWKRSAEVVFPLTLNIEPARGFERLERFERRSKIPSVLSSAERVSKGWNFSEESSATALRSAAKNIKK